MASTAQAPEFAVGKDNDDLKGGNESEPWTILAAKDPKKGWTQYNPRTMRKPALTSDTKHIKIMSYNENDVEEIKSSLLKGYEHSFYACCVTKAGYSGTAVISRIKPLSVRYGLGVPEHDEEGRLVTLEFDTFFLVGGYIPNASTDLKRLELEKVKPVILTGDLNCAYEDIDVHSPKSLLRKAGFTYEERQSFKQQFLKKGMALGLLSQSILAKVYDSYILPDVDGSDHSPIGLILTL
ncbi:hypothetical protein AgCh_003798 [Apium graveolens]